MKLQYRHQKFQADAAKAVVDVFAGQPYLTPTYMMDRGITTQYTNQSEELKIAAMDVTGFSNQKIVPELSDRRILEQMQKIQRANQIKPSDRLEGRYNLTVEMETGVGKTYTYIKTMFELNKHYGWSKFTVVVPSVAIREGVYKSFEMTQEHFAEEYGKKIRFFIYNSAQLTELDRFASDSAINVMIINSQAFNAKGKDARRIYMKLDEFRSRRPIDIIAKTNPILIIDEPQSVEGKQTKERLKEFCPLLTLRYSATHRSDSIYNMVFRLDVMEAYNRHLVKKIAVKGITESGTTATDSYVYLEGINLSKSDPTATLQFEVKMAGGGIKKKSRIVKIGDNLYDYSNGLEEYKNGFVVKQIDGRDDSVEFLNGIKIFAGDVIGTVDEDQLRRIQIRETILSHIQRERELFYKGIKVLSLFFIDEVANYREYDAAGQPVNGKYAAMFEEEYQEIVDTMQLGMGEDEYIRYLRPIPAARTHAGYFSVDGKGKMVNSKVGRKETTSDDVSAYELIMKNKELLLDRNPARSPVRFIFSHSALREGWDNPNVFQICTLKQSGSEVRKRQEVGRGLRLCVNQSGERMDTTILGGDVHNINVLTVIASESYDSFARGLQMELAEAVADRPRAVTAELFTGQVIKDEQGNEQVIDRETAMAIHYDLIGKLVDETGLTRKAVVAILKGIQPGVFKQFKANPEEFIVKAAALINDEKATAVIEHITYNALKDRYDEKNIFTAPTIKGRLGVNAMETKRHLYDHLVYDSSGERDFATELDRNMDVAVYVKLPSGFYISTPVGKYNPDWAIAFYEGTVKHIYFVAETKGTLDTLRFNHITPIEQAKIDCAREHFKAISDKDVVYDVVDSYKTLLEKVMR